MTKPRFTYLAAPLFALAAFGAANAAPEAAPQVQPALVNEPIATALKVEGPDAELAAQIVQALNQEASLKGSKITIQPDNGENPVIWITGVTQTEQQAQRVSDIVGAASSGQKAVANLIQPEHITTKTPQYYRQQLMLAGAAPELVGATTD